jgi:hypothetical protein
MVHRSLIWRFSKVLELAALNGTEVDTRTFKNRSRWNREAARWTHRVGTTETSFRLRVALESNEIHESATLI